MVGEGDTLADRWLKSLKNNPVVASIIVLGVAVSATAVFWNALPRPVRDFVVDALPSGQGATETSQPGNGWVFAGYVDKKDEFAWASPQRVKLIKPSGGTDQPHIFRNGDVVRPLRPLPQVIADYRTRGTQYQLIAPWRIVEEIRKSDDFTGRLYQPDGDLEVMDVSVSSLPGHDAAVWLRVVPVE